MKRTILYTICYMLYAIYCIPYTTHDILPIMCQIVSTMYYTLYTVISIYLSLSIYIYIYCMRLYRRPRAPSRGAAPGPASALL